MLELAEAHQNACLDALVELEGMSRRSVVEDTAEWLLAQIAGDYAAGGACMQVHRTATYTRTELTRRFAANPGRVGTLTPSRLYGEIIPRLIAMGRCQGAKVGKQVSYTFNWE